LHVVLGTLTIPLVALLASVIGGGSAALLAALLLSVEQFHIGWSRLAMPEVVLLFFVALALVFFFVGVQGGRRLMWLAAGVCAACAVLCKLIAVVLLVPLGLYFVVRPRAWRPGLRAMALVMLPVVLAGAAEAWWNYRGASGSLAYACGEATERPGISLKSFAFFVGEIVMVTAPEEAWHGGDPGYYEWPVMHWVTGAVLLAGCAGSPLAKGESRLRILQVLFAVAFLVPTVTYTTRLWNPFWHASPSLIPAVAMTALVMAQMWRRGRGARWGIALLLLYMGVHACSFAASRGVVFRPLTLAGTLWYGPF
jgi:4-amino-4-deoxy-L-arabinose transferase-like glycosyltransferase